ncbi:MAG: metallophosphoesterase [Proteobacteria bacterium]|nr:metallophosphoesterase [Pseudomonadota bacterium]
MAFVIIQLSDIHFSTAEPTNSLMDRKEKLIDSIRSELSYGEHCLFVLSGDIADRGKPQEYEIATSFIDELHKYLLGHLGHPPEFVIIPGNHDHDFDHEDYDEQLRDTVISSVSPSNPPSEKMHEILLQPQAPFRNFADSIKVKYGAYTADECFISHIVHLGEDTVRFLLLNSTRFSKKNEETGKTWFPVEDLSQFLSKNPADGTLSIGVIHHPYKWHHPDNANKLKIVLEEFCDVLLTGHEHQIDRYLKTRKSTEQNLYVEGGVLQDHCRPNESTFNIVRIDQDKNIFRCKSKSWTGQIYDAITEESEHRYLRLRQVVRNDFELNADWHKWLEQVGTDFRHPRAHDINLSDLFVYPDLRKLDVKRACKPSGLVRDREVLGYIQDKRRVLIAGNEKMGKTSLCKSLFSDLREAGLVSIIFRSEFTFKSNKNKSVQERLREVIDTVVKRIYVPSSAARFWNTPIENRAIIIDDYDRLALSIGGRDSLLNWCNDNFGIVIVTADPGIRMREVLNRTLDDTILWTFEHVDILESDRETRDALIFRWLTFGTDPFEVSQEEIYKTQIRYAQTIDALIGQGAIPSVPLFVLMMLQQLETRGSIESPNGLYGALYELIIRDVIKSACRKLSDVEVRLNYLSEFAYNLYSLKLKYIKQSSFEEWHKSYCDDYNLILNCQEVVSQLREIGVLRRDTEAVGFKYRYYYCYFLARYLSHHIHEQPIVDEVEKLSTVLYNIDAANTMLFLCHLSKNPHILNMILMAAKRHFLDADKYDLSQAPKVLPEGRITPTPLMLVEDSSPAEERKQSLRRHDDTDPPRGLEKIQEDSKDELEGDVDIIQLVNEANSAHHAHSGEVGRLFRMIPATDSG